MSENLGALARPPLPILLGMLGSLGLRLRLIPLQGYIWDINTFHYWLWVGAERGISGMYLDQHYPLDYPPGSSWIFLGLGKLADSLGLLGTPQMNYFLKIPANLADLGIGYAIYAALAHCRYLLRIMASYSYLFNPGVIFNSAIWGQMDAIYALALLYGFLWISNRPILGTISATLSALIKPQAISIALVLGIYALIRYKLRSLILCLISLGVVAGIIIPTGVDPLWLMRHSYLEGYQKYPYLSLNAFNLWGIFGFWIPDGISLAPGISFQQLGWMLFSGAMGIGISILIKARSLEELYYSGYLIGLDFFSLLTRMHERYLFPVFGFLGLVWGWGYRIWIIYWILSVCYLVNLSSVLYHTLNSQSIIKLGWAPDYFELSSKLVPPVILGILIYSSYLGLRSASLLQRRSSGIS